jgi:site-specific DNA recombinase
MPDSGLVRCAIYTRKSTEEGLNQEFNSLEAQREAAEAYILSQAQNRWTTLRERYDDGGFSGASIDRPAMRKLLADVEAGRIDCVVVYKVDRLSRSLLDFARMMEMFDERGVSFVSVTQDFNTRSSLGRLTLHILLSFAQFEREIIGERTRDKLSAARRKGKWTGGCPVLGYDVDPLGRRLQVNPQEAEQIRQMFEIASTTGSLTTALATITTLGYRTKRWTSRVGILHSAKPFTRASLRRLLSNVLYTGNVEYQGQRYAGEHASLVSEDLWTRVQQQLQLKRRQRRIRTIDGKHHSLLASVLQCAMCGKPMLPMCTRPHGRVYRYYVCPTREASCASVRVTADAIETSLLRHLEPILGCHLSRPVLQQALDRVIYDAATRRIAISFHDGTHSEYALAEPYRRSVARRRLESLARIPRISRLMALAIRLESLVREGKVGGYGDLVAAGQISRPRMSQILGLLELAPAIQEQLLFLPKIICGRDPIHEHALRKITRIVDWEDQVEAFRHLMALTQEG